MIILASKYRNYILSISVITLWLGVVVSSVLVVVLLYCLSKKYHMFQRRKKTSLKNLHLGIHRSERFKQVLPDIGNEWRKIVAWERRDPNFTPTIYTKICAEHFTPDDFTPAKILIKTAVPTININRCDDTDAEKVYEISSTLDVDDDDVVYISEHKVSTPPVIVDQNDDIICVIENQISAESKLQNTDEQDMEQDIEQQIQWSLVGTSKHFDGLVTTKIPEAPVNTTPSSHPFNIKQKTNVDEDVIIIDHEDIVIERNKNEYKDSQSLMTSTYLASERDTSKEEDRENLFENQFSQFLSTYNKDKYWYISQPNSPRLSKKNKSTIQPQEENQPKAKMSKLFQATAQQYAAPKLCEIVTPQPTQQSKQKIVQPQSISLAPHQLKTVTQPIITADPQQFATLTLQSLPTSQENYAVTLQPTPVELIKTSQLTIPQLTTTPLLATTQMKTPVFASSQISTPIMVYDATSPNGSKQLISLVPSNFSVSGVQLSSVFLEENNVKTYYLSHIIPSTNLVEKDHIKEEEKVPKSSLNNNTQERNCLIQSESPDSEQFAPVIVKTETCNNY